MKCSQVGSWCTRDGKICDNHASNSPIQRNDGNKCLDRFYGLCNKGSRYMPHDADPKSKEITIKQCTKSEYLVDYAKAIGMTFPVENEFMDSVFISVEGNLYAILLKDCEVRLKTN